MKLSEIESYIKFNYKPVKGKWEGIVIHHSLTYDTLLSNWEAIRKYHMIERGWRDIGYHFGIEKVNNNLKYQIGRGLVLNGAHTIGLNQTHLGICLVGDYDKVMPSQEQYEYISDLIILLKKYFNIKEVIGHREAIIRLKNEPLKSCPGDKFDLEYLRKLCGSQFSKQE